MISLIVLIVLIARIAFSTFLLFYPRLPFIILDHPWSASTSLNQLTSSSTSLWEGYTSLEPQLKFWRKFVYLLSEATVNSPAVSGIVVWQLKKHLRYWKKKKSSVQDNIKGVINKLLTFNSLKIEEMTCS